MLYKQCDYKTISCGSTAPRKEKANLEEGGIKMSGKSNQGNPQKIALENGTFLQQCAAVFNSSTNVDFAACFSAIRIY